jgi:hypothetical protein
MPPSPQAAAQTLLTPEPLELITHQDLFIGRTAYDASDPDNLSQTWRLSGSSTSTRKTVRSSTLPLLGMYPSTKQSGSATVKFPDNAHEIADSSWLNVARVRIFDSVKLIKSTVGGKSLRLA